MMSAAVPMTSLPPSATGTAWLWIGVGCVYSILRMAFIRLSSKPKWANDVTGRAGSGPDTCQQTHTGRHGVSGADSGPDTCQQTHTGRHCGVRCRHRRSSQTPANRHTPAGCLLAGVGDGGVNCQVQKVWVTAYRMLSLYNAHVDCSDILPFISIMFHFISLPVPGSFTNIRLRHRCQKYQNLFVISLVSVTSGLIDVECPRAYC